MFPNQSSEINILLLVESIRSLAGSLSKNPIWCYTPKQVKRLSGKTIKRLQKLNVVLISFEIDEKVLQFPFSGEVQAASLAEAKAHDGIDYLVWLNSNTIILQEPKEFLLNEGMNLGFSPVHHTLIGSRYEYPIDPFWKLIYNLKVPSARASSYVDTYRWNEDPSIF